MPTLKVKTVYIQKLKKLGVYDQWLANLKAQYKDAQTGNNATLKELTEFSDREKWESFVSYSFVFSKTPEGYDFWRTIKDS